MTDQGEMQRIGTSGVRMYGQRGLLVCGLPLDERDCVLGLAEGLPELPVIFVSESDEQATLGDLLQQPHESGKDTPSSLARAIIMSGLTEVELHLVMKVYRQLGMERPMWATLTPTSEQWSIGRLLTELAAEDGRFQDNA